MAQRGAAGTRWALVRRAFAAALAAVAGVGTAVAADLEAAWDAQLRGLLPQAHTLLEADGPASPEHRFALAGVALELGDLDGAQAALEPLAGDAAHPDFPRAALLLGRLHLAAGRDGAARRALFASLERSADGPYAAAAYLALIRLDLHAGAVDDAGQRLRLLAEMGPSPESEIAAGLLRGDGASGPVRPFPSPVALFAAARLSAGAATPPLPPPGGAQEPGGARVTPSVAGLQPITPDGAGEPPSVGGARPIASAGAGAARSADGAHPTASADAGATASAAGAHSTAPGGVGAPSSAGVRPIASAGADVTLSSGAHPIAPAGAGVAASIGEARSTASAGAGATPSSRAQSIAPGGAGVTPSVGGARPVTSAGAGAPSSAGVRPIASAGADATLSSGAQPTAPAGADAPSSTGGVRPTVPAGAGLRPIAPVLAGASPTAAAPPAGDPSPTAAPAPAAAPQAPSAAPQRGLQPAAAAAAGADARFTLRLGSFRDAANAQHMVTALTDAGFPARSRTFGHFHRVLVGAAATRQAAESLLSRLRTIGYDGDVIPYPPDAGR